MKEKVEKALDTIRPILRRDGGDIELVKVEEDEKVVHVKLQGACAGCPGAMMTLKMVVEEAVRREIPDLKSVEAVPF